MNDRLYLLLPIVLFLGLIYAVDVDEETVESNQKKIRKTNNVYYPYTSVKDTFYILGDEYIKVSLNDQIAKVVFRNDSNVAYRISSGNGNITKGKFTPTGFYTVQSKNPKAISKQFDDAELLNWVGFNGNIGFHGLAGSGYYGHLGKRPSSHGCIRISRDDGADLYKRVKVGTPVFVYLDEPAVEVCFANADDIKQNIDFVFQANDKSTEIFFKNRLNALYDGEYFEQFNNKVFFDCKKVIRNSGIQIGSATKLPEFQKMPYQGFNTSFKIKDILTTNNSKLYYWKKDSSKAQK
jgi:hypothetical protein